MFKGFNLNLKKTDLIEKPHDTYRACLNYILNKNDLLNEHKEIVKTELDKYLAPDGVLSGTDMQKDWFPQVKADIFISHSHADEDCAKALADWLYQELGLTSFIDSCIWGYVNDLLAAIDKKFCKNENERTYNYSKRNLSTSHVHMMLSSALAMMIDKTECLIFMNTPNSIRPAQAKDETLSPWIYSEIAISQIVRKQELKRKVNFSKSLNESEKKDWLKYELDLRHLTELDISTLKSIARKGYKGCEALDKLYELTTDFELLNG